MKITFQTESFHTGEFTTAWCYLSDDSGQPCHGTITLFDTSIVCNSDKKTFALNFLYEVNGFGKVMLQTAVSSKKVVDLLNATIEGRLDQISKELINSSPKVKKIFSKKIALLKKNRPTERLLRELLILGEELTLANAKEKLAIRKARGELKDFLIGGQAFGIEKGDEYKKVHQESFDLGIAPFYFFLLKDKSENEINFELTDQIVAWLEKTGRPIKGHPLVWFHKFARPEWMLSLTYPEVKRFLEKHIPEVITRYKDSIKIWDIINEVPTADANGFDYSFDQLMELTKLTSDLVKKLQPDAERILNISDIFGPHSYVHEKPSVPPIYFLKQCKKYGIEYESIGLQFYMGMRKEFACRELLNISQTIDEYLQFGKTIHFSELGWPSQHDVDPDSFFSADHPEVAGRWHRGWDEKLQAEFLEKIYIIFASKQHAKSITWWDITDNGTHRDIGSRFIPFSGLTRRDFSPKPALKTLQKFRRDIHNTR